jgi:hypothetical protein
VTTIVASDIDDAATISSIGWVAPSRAKRRERHEIEHPDREVRSGARREPGGRSAAARASRRRTRAPARNMSRDDAGHGLEHDQAYRSVVVEARSREAGRTAWTEPTIARRSRSSRRSPLRPA